MKKKECRAGERCAQLKIKDSIYDGSKTYGLEAKRYCNKIIRQKGTRPKRQQVTQ